MQIMNKTFGVLAVIVVLVVGLYFNMRSKVGVSEGVEPVATTTSTSPVSVQPILQKTEPKTEVKAEVKAEPVVVKKTAETKKTEPSVATTTSPKTVVPENPTPVVSAEVEIPWRVELVVLDGVDVATKVRTPFEEAAKFIADRSRFKLEYGITVVSDAHTFTHYDCGVGKDACVVVNASDMTDASIAKLPTKMSYIMFWKAGQFAPLQAGSTWGAANGLTKDGVAHAYATIPTDLWWYSQDPYEGFNDRSAQIIAHETINVINTVLENAPYHCASLTATDGDPATKYEGDRLAKLNADCYSRLPAQF